jgi:hypothetical protein
MRREIWQISRKSRSVRGDIWHFKGRMTELMQIDQTVLKTSRTMFHLPVEA